MLTLFLNAADAPSFNSFSAMSVLSNSKAIISGEGVLHLGSCTMKNQYTVSVPWAFATLIMVLLLWVGVQYSSLPPVCSCTVETHIVPLSFTEKESGGLTMGNSFLLSACG